VRIGINAFEYCDESLFDKNTIPGFSLVDGWLVDLDYDYFEDYESHLSLNGCRGIADTLCPLFDNVESIDIPETVKGIGSGGLFSGPFWFSDLHQISIPGSVEYVGVNALSTSSQELFTTNMETGAIMIDGWIVGLAYSKMKTDFDASTAKGIAELDIFSGTFSQYGQIGELLSFRFPTNTTYIQNGMFQGCTELGRDSSTIIIPESVVHIGDQAFDGCSSLKNIVIPKGVVYIGEDAFGHCDGLTNLFISSSVAYIGSFTGCDHLERVTAPLSLKPLIEAMEIFDEGIVTYYEGDSAQWWNDGYIVTFDANGGTVAESERAVAKGKAVGELPKPVRTGYTFNGWYTKASGGTKVKMTTKVTKDVTYYAQWTANKYAIKFNANGGTGTMKSLAAIYGKNVTLTANAFKRTNWTFLGWATKKDATEAKYTNKQKVKNLTATDGKTVTLYAVWKRNTYTVKFNANGGTGATQKQTLNCGSSVKLAKNAYTREGFTFAGWATTKGGKVVYKNKATVKDLAKNGKSVTLYAVWKPAKWAVGTFSGKGDIGSTNAAKRKTAKVTLTVASDGKISGKFVRKSDKKSFAFKADVFTEFSEGALRVTTTIKYDSKKCDLDIAVAQDGEGGATVAELSVTYKDKEYGVAFLE